MINESIMKFADDGRTERRIDNGDGTGHLYVWNANGELITDQPLTGLEIPPFPPLDALGRMATLSAILHNDPEDWSNASGIPVEHLIAEAQAWSLGGQ